MPLTADRLASKKTNPIPIKVSRGVAANAVIYTNSLVGVNADGYVEPCDGVGPYAQILYSPDHIEGSAVDGEVRGTFLRNITVELEGLGFDETLNGKEVEAVDDYQVQPFTNGVKVGTVSEVLSPTRMFVEIP